jgi:hypothetical protein
LKLGVSLSRRFLRYEKKKRCAMVLEYVAIDALTFYRARRCCDVVVSDQNILLDVEEE